MDRRNFLTALVGVTGAVALAGVATSANAASIVPALDKDEPTAEGFFKKLGEAETPEVENVQYYYRRRYGYRRRRYRCYLRRTYYGWRRVCRWW